MVWKPCLQPSPSAGAQHFKPQILPICSPKEAGGGSDRVTLVSEFHPDLFSDQFADGEFHFHPSVSPPVK